MAKSTLIFLFILTIVATLLFGINLGKKLKIIQSKPLPTPTIAQPTIKPCGEPDRCVPQRECYVQRWKRDDCSNFGGEFICCAPLPTTLISPSPTPLTKPKPKIVGSDYIDTYCGFSVPILAGYIRQQTSNENSGLFVDSGNSANSIAFTCAETIPRPPLAPDKKEIITIAGVTAELYHDQAADGSPREDVFVKNPKNNLEIIIAGWGAMFNNTLKTFKFL